MNESMILVKFKSTKKFYETQHLDTLRKSIDKVYFPVEHWIRCLYCGDWDVLKKKFQHVRIFNIFFSKTDCLNSFFLNL